MLAPENNKSLVIRADASTQMGTGHVMRCLALAQAWQGGGGKAVFIMAKAAPALEARLRSEGLEVLHLSTQAGSAEEAEETASLVSEVKTISVVVDGYHFSGDYQRILKNSGLHLVFVDDYGHADHYYADFVLNQNIYAHEGLYINREPYTQLLLGTRYVMLRREFWRWQGWQRSLPSVAKRVLVTLGGSDPDNVTLKVIQALQLLDIDGLDVVVVVGGGNPHDEQLKAVVEKCRFPIRLAKNVTNMPELMAWADVAIAAGGSTSWELAFMGLPSIVLVLADNQKVIAQELGKMEVVINLEWYEDVSIAEMGRAIAQLLKSTDSRRKMTQLGQQLVDGEGSARVLMHLEGKPIRLRRVRQDDCKLLWDWANEAEVRAVSFSAEPIPWEHHIDWFQARLNAPNCCFYMALNRDDIPIGQIRYDLEGDQAVVSISIARNFRHQGYGSTLIRLASKQLFQDADVTMIHAYIKPEHEKSLRVFLKADFQDIGRTIVKGHQAIHLALRQQAR